MHYEGCFIIRFIDACQRICFENSVLKRATQTRLNPALTVPRSEPNSSLILFLELFCCLINTSTLDKVGDIAGD